MFVDKKINMKYLTTTILGLIIISSCQSPKPTAVTHQEILKGNSFLEGRSDITNSKSDRPGYHYIIPESQNMNNESQQLATELVKTHFQYTYDYEGGISACLNKINQLPNPDVNQPTSLSDNVRLMTWSYSMMDLYIKHHPDSEAAANVLIRLLDQAEPVEWLILTEALRTGREELHNQGMYETLKSELKKRIIEYQALSPYDDMLSQEDLLSLDNKATAALDIIKTM